MSVRFQMLDGLRGISALLVVIHHWRAWPQPLGSFAVDLFFILSSFLLTSRLCNPLNSNNQTKKQSNMTEKIDQELIGAYCFFNILLDELCVLFLYLWSTLLHCITCQGIIDGKISLILTGSSPFLLRLAIKRI